jgi:hypothetical protein
MEWLIVALVILGTGFAIVFYSRATTSGRRRIRSL